MSNNSTTQKLQELFELYQSGAITKEEFDSLKSELLGFGGTLTIKGKELSKPKVDLHKNAIYLLENNQIEEAIEIFKDISIPGQDDLITTIYVGIGKALEGNYKSALNILNPIFKIKSENSIHINRGLLFLTYCLYQCSAAIWQINEQFILIDFEILKKYHHLIDEQPTVQTIEFIITSSLKEIKHKPQIIHLTDSYLNSAYFSKNYNSRIAEIWYAIANKQVELKSYAKALNSFQKAITLMPDQSIYQEKHLEIKQLLEVNSKRKRRKAFRLFKYSIFIIILGIAISIFTLRYLETKSIELETKSFELAQLEKTTEAYETYLSKYPEGRHSIEIKKLLYDIRDGYAWRVAKLTNTYAGYYSYLRNYSIGAYVKEAKDNIRILKEAEDKLHNKVNIGDTSTENNPSPTSEVLEDKTSKNNVNNANDSSVNDQVTDIDGNIYKTVKIGNQTWMVENLKTTKFNDGTSIPLVPENEVWSNLNTPAYCWYENDAIKHKSAYGALYNWYVVNSGKLCPKGWHVPRKSEWETLVNFSGGINLAGGKLKEIGTVHWKSPNNSATNESGFTGLAGGYRSPTGLFEVIEIGGNWWSSSDFDFERAWAWGLVWNGTSVGNGLNKKIFGFSVRCLKNN